MPWKPDEALVVEFYGEVNNVRRAHNMDYGIRVTMISKRLLTKFVRALDELCKRYVEKVGSLNKLSKLIQ